MKDERLKVLQMIEEGKISVEDATKLLDAFKNSQSAKEQKDLDLYKKVSDFNDSIEQFAKDLGDKFSEAYKDMEPKLRDATKKVVEKTAVFVDDISKSLNKSLDTWDSDLCANDEECQSETHVDIIDDVETEISDEEVAEEKDSIDTNLPN